jgi:hypothetical protein
MATTLLSNGKILADVVDPLNEYSNRTYENSCWEDYNCMSFAFQKWGVWYHPCATDDQFERFYDHYSLESGEVNTEDEIYYTFEEISNCKIDAKKTFAAYNHRYNDYEDGFDAYTAIAIEHDYRTMTALRVCADNIINAFKNVRIIQNIEEANENEYVVAMAGSAWDFHFGVYIPTLGVYCHKMGRDCPEIAEDFDDIFGEDYDSERIYFAVEGNFEDVYEMVVEDSSEFFEE